MANSSKEIETMGVDTNYSEILQKWITFYRAETAEQLNFSRSEQRVYS